MKNNDLSDSYQYAYWTKKVLLKVHSDITETINKGSSPWCNRPCYTIIALGVFHWHQGKAFSWMKSFWHNPVRFFQWWNITRWRVLGIRVRTITNTYGVYTKPVCEIIKRHNFSYHCYADDIHVYVALKPGVKQYLLFSFVKRKKKTENPHIRMGSNCIKASAFVRNLNLFLEASKFHI